MDPSLQQPQKLEPFSDFFKLNVLDPNYQSVSKKSAVARVMHASSRLHSIALGLSWRVALTGEQYTFSKY
jgi:hypothetical protein